MADLKLEDLLKEQPKTETKEISENEAKELVKQEIKPLSPEDKEKVEKIKNELDLRDSSAANLFGVSTQNSIAQFSDEILSKVRAKDAGETGELMTDLLVKVRNVNYDDEGGNFLSKIFNSGKNKIEKYIASYDDLSGQIDSISAKLQNEQKELIKQVQLFDRLYEQNLNYYNDLEIYIMAGNEKIADMRDNQIPRLLEEAKASDNPMALQVVTDLQDNVNRFEKKVHDLKISQTLAMQSAPQIKLIQNNDQLLANKITDAINHTIPLWKSQTVIALGLAKQEEVLKMQKAISDATNEMIRENARKLKKTTIGVREEAERSTVDIETLEEANKELIEAIEGSIEISKKAQEQRKQSEEKMVQIKTDLKTALMSAMNEGVKL
ncbi:toxic anion resistance protein [Helcococcus kunzii]|uniref:toxic anion resistance protein n=1 Tax=Helcococcus kunzii TaxID=40091 RepID=UPI001BAE6298|nr:toxic anion resistance protein [Helcococcus kunzii]MCT1796066.1 toxic anion resistance protein [Helcococcus kunzii]MCT1989761.1 toxic anion resistance protein [Helcococcus kunzii]QUY64446.1 toxic anion resistance protein [Helcococcus kunzii]QZO76857.1 toxic anion resistance protein [Helcococcus kunzii]